MAAPVSQPAATSEPPKVVAEEVPASEPPKAEASAAPPPPPPPPEPKKAKNAMATPTKKKQPDEKSFAGRAAQGKRAARRAIWAKLKFEGDFDDALFDEKLEAHVAAKTAAPPSDGSSERTKQLEAENHQLKAKLIEAQKKAKKLEADAIAKANELEDYKAEHEIKEAARSVGIIDPDYAFESFRKHAASTPEGKESPQPSAFFEEMRKDPKRKHLFQAIDVPAGPPTLKPASGEPAAPTPKPNGAEPAPATSALEMSKKDFNARLRTEFGYTPGS